MHRTNVEIKAKWNDHAEVRKILLSHSAEFKGTDHQVDTYFNVKNGRLKLREGKIENYLIHYLREDKEGPKQSNVLLYKSGPGSALKDILRKSLGILTVVDKSREIYFIDNVKFHLDTVSDLGTFIEIEAIDSDGTITPEKLYEQCRMYMGLFKIEEENLISDSYSDMLLKHKKKS
jgi:adenylate cyclase, class 2